KKRSDIYHLASGEDLQEVRLPELGRYPQVQALGDDLIEHRLYTLIRGGDIVNNGKVTHVAFGLKEIRRNPILLMQQPEELFRRKALKVARSEARNKDQSSGDSFLKLTEQWSRQGTGELLLTADDGNAFEVHYFDEGEDDRFPGTRHRLTLSHGDKNIGYLHVRMTGLTATLYLSFSDDAYHYRDHFYKDNPFSSAEDFDFYHDVFGMPSGQVEAIFVSEEYGSRYRGLGTSLLGLAMRLAQAKGVERFEADAVGPEPFFENLGFKAFRFRGTAQKVKDYELPLTPERMRQEGVELPPIDVSRRREQKDMRFGRSEIRNFDDAGETSWKVGTLNYFAHDKIKRLLDFARSAFNQKQSIVLVNDILDRTPVFSGFNNHSIRFFDWRPVWLHTLEQRALREQDPVVRTKLLFLAQGFEMIGRNSLENREYLRISSLLTDTYQLAREIEMDNDLSSIEQVRIDFEGEAEKIPGYLFIPSESPTGKNFPVVVIFHGLTSRKEHPYFDLLIKKLIENKMAVLSVDLPRHGEYKKEFEGLDHFSRYARAIIQYLKLQTEFPSMDKEQIALFGFSFGGYIGLRLMLEREIEKEFQAVVVMNPPFQDSFLFESALRDHREYLEAIFNESEFEKLISLVGRLALNENMFSFSPRQLEKLRIFLGEEDSVIATSDIGKVRRAFPTKNITLYQGEGHYFTNEVKNDAYQKTAEFFTEAFNRSELRKTDLRPVAEVILTGRVSPSVEKLQTASEILKREQKSGRSLAALIRELRRLMTEFVLDPVSPPSASDLQPETKESRVSFDALKTIEEKVTVEVHMPASVEQAPEDVQGILMDGFFRFVDGMVRLNPNFNFRLVFSSKEKKDRLRRFRRFNSTNVRMISQKNRKFITDQSNEPAQLVIAENFPASLASHLEGNGRFGFDAGTFADQSPVDWLGPDRITLEQTTLAALTTLASEKLKDIVPDPSHPNIYRAAGKSVLQGMEVWIHRLAVEVTQSVLSKRSA
ncbi:MAG TPA: alpha/beta fold hydrolase, partial [bacterium]|nr:alpha/beta fold hydrolase [bacterium]